MYADLNGWRVNGGTIPHDLVLTEQIPDLVIIDRSDTPAKVVLLELTVTWDSSNSFQTALQRKTARYERLAEDLRDKGYTTLNLCRGLQGCDQCSKPPGARDCLQTDQDPSLQEASEFSGTDCAAHTRKPGRLHTGGNFPMVRASVGLAGRDSNVSQGSVFSPTCFSLLIYEMKKYILSG